MAERFVDIEEVRSSILLPRTKLNDKNIRSLTSNIFSKPKNKYMNKIDNLWAWMESDHRPLSYQDSVLPLNYMPIYLFGK